MDNKPKIKELAARADVRLRVLEMGSHQPSPFSADIINKTTSCATMESYEMEPWLIEEALRQSHNFWRVFSLFVVYVAIKSNGRGGQA